MSLEVDQMTYQFFDLFFVKVFFCFCCRSGSFHSSIFTLLSFINVTFSEQFLRISVLNSANWLLLPS